MHFIYKLNSPTNRNYENIDTIWYSNFVWEREYILHINTSQSQEDGCKSLEVIGWAKTIDLMTHNGPPFAIYNQKINSL